MKKDHNTQPIKVLIDNLLKAYGMESKMNEVELVNCWEQVMGKMVARHTDEIELRGKVLHVKLNSAALRHTLSFSKEEMVEQLNEAMQRPVIEEVVVR